MVEGRIADGDVDFQARGGYEAEVFSTTSSDLIEVTGTATLGGVLDVDFQYTPTVGDVITILTDEACDPKDIDRAQAQATLEEALKVDAKGEKDLSEKHRKVGLARVRVRIANEAASS